MGIRNASFAAVAIVVALVVAPSHAQRGAGAAGGSKPVPRAADGKPDLSGIWIASGAMPLLIGAEATAALLKADAAAGRPPAPPREAPPYKPAAEARRQEYLARRGIDDPMALCLISGVPRITFRPCFQIFQLPDRFMRTKSITRFASC